MNRRLFISLALVTVALALPARADYPGNPILNGDFEIYLETIGSGGYADGAIWWSHGYESNAVFEDADGDADLEAVVAADPGASNHNFWQTTLPPLEVPTANFDAFAWTLEGGAIAPSANNQIGFSLSPSFSQHPFVGAFWDGAVMFRADDMAATMDEAGRVHLDPALHGEIICPDFEPCRTFKLAFDAADTEGKRELLGQARIVQVSFWNFNRLDEGEAVIDDVAIDGASMIVEELAAGNVSL